MKIEIGTTVLCAGVAGAEYLEDFAIDGEEVVQMATFLRAAAGKALARGNTTTSISFSVSKEHANFETAEGYLCKMQADIPKTGDVVFTTEAAATPSEKYKLSDATIKRASRRQIGVSTRCSYLIQGGDFAVVTS